MAAGHRPLLLAMALASGFSALPAAAQPSGAQAIHGSATLSQQGANLVVTTRNGAGSRHSAINWQSFSIPGGSTTHFAQPDAASTSINRVLGGNPSAIFGTLSSNGRLVLVNPAGITVGAGAVVDTAGFTASTLRMSDADAIAGRLRFGDGGAAGPLRVDGRILATGGDVVLVGTDVQAGAQAVIRSPQGATVLAAGQRVEITGRGLEGIRMEVQAPADQAVNLGTLQGDAVGIFAGTLRHSGMIQASAASVQGGRVVLKAADHAETSGTIVAQGADGAGGRVDVLGRTVGVMSGAVIDTSNTGGGGSIRVGGDYLGGNPEVPNAQITYVAADARLRANATGQGDGGRVIVWADDTTRMHGRIEARGGAGGGHGGFVETSGKRWLDVNGARVDASAAAGRAGEWLLDPSDLTISAAGIDTNGILNPFTAGIGNSLLTLATLNGALAGGTMVTLRTDGSGTGGSGDVIFDASAGMLDIVHGLPGAGTLNVQAFNDIVFTGGTTSFRAAGSSLQDFQINLQAGNAVRTSSGSTVALSTGDATSRITASVLDGKSWTNHGTLTLNQNAKLDMASGGTLTNHGTLNGAAGTLGGVSGGYFHNASTGTVSLTQGRFDVAGFSGGGSVFYSGDGFSTDALSFDGSQFKVLAAGNVSLSGAASLRATGDVELGFDLSADAIDLQAGGHLKAQSLSTYGSDGTAASGRVKLQAGGNVDFTDIRTVGNSDRPYGGMVQIDAGAKVIGGNITTSGAGYAGNARGGAVQVKAGAGGIFLAGSVVTSGNTGYGAHGGAVDLSATGGQIEVQGVISTYGDEHYSGTGGAGGAVTVSNTGGGITLHGNVDSYGGGGSLGAAGGGMVKLSAAGGLNVYGGISSYGGNAWWNSGERAGGAAGNVELSAGGDIDIGHVYAWGGDSSGGVQGAAGGKVSITTPGSLTVWDLDASGGSSYSGTGGHGQSITLAAGQSLQVGGLYASGGYSQYGGQGGNAAAVTLSYGDQLYLDYVDAAGGDGGYNSEGVGGTGGRGATVTIVKERGDLELADLYMNLDGGWGGDGRVGGQGGQGGTLNLVARNGGVKLTGSDVSARGGDGGYSYGSFGGSNEAGGTGGQGGTIRISATGASQILAWLDASGGDGGAGDAYYGSRGGNGGQGGAIDIQVGGPLTLGGGLWAGGGHGGTSASYEYAALVTDPLAGDPALAGADGALGGVYLAAAGGITVPADVPMPVPTSTPTFTESAVTTEIPPIPGDGGYFGSLQVDGALTNASSLNLAAGATLLVSGPVTNQGSIDLGTGATMAIGYTYDAVADTYTFGSGTLTNAAGARLTGTGTVQGSVVNAGTVAPGQGGAGRIGQLSITGNYLQTATGRLEMDVAANSPYLPGLTYDQLNVGGTMTMGGQLVVSAVPAVTVASATQLAAGTTATTSGTPVATQFYELLKAAAADGRFDLVTGPGDVLTGIRMNINGTILEIPGNRLAAGADGLLAAIAAMLPGVNIATLQQLLIESMNNALPDRDRDDKASGESDIVVTEAACKPA